MALKLDKLVVIDVEATCWKGTPPPTQSSEIIEVGVCVLDLRTGDIEGKRSILVRPARSEVSPFCTELTTLTQDMVDTGVSFKKACDILREEYSTHRRCWASWGDYDRTQFAKDCKANGVRSPFGKAHLNGKNLFGMLYGYTNAPGMAKALKRLNLPLEGTHHRGHDDAENIAKILRVALGRNT